jgi:ATP-dependent helicase HrpB
VTALPIDALLPRVVESLRTHPNLIIEAAPGAGKTTRVPPALLSLCELDVLVLEPRRLAARLAARRVAEELGERLGETVGYQVRFEEVAGPRTRLRFLTEGVLTRRLLSDPTLRGAGIVVLDEFHERHLDTDLALALLRRLQRTSRRDLKLVVMSATLDAEPVSRFLGGAPVLRSEGRLHPIDIAYTPHSGAPLEEQVASAVDRLDNREGHVLVFLPGAAEIRRAARACEPAARRLQLATVPLHGDLSPEEQDRAVAPGGQRRLILSTNVAESSITIDGVTSVIDSGLARIAADSPWTGLPAVEVTRISKASANQRAGRAGRTAPGHVIRLYSLDDFARRRDHDPPEIARRELSQVLLDLYAMGAEDVEWFETPPAEAAAAAEALLARLGRENFRDMARLPLHPRLARLVVEARRRGAGESGVAVAAVLSAGQRTEAVDLLHLAEAEWPPHVKRIYDQIRRAAGPVRGRDDAGTLISVLAAFPDRVARRRQGREYNLASGGSAVTAADLPHEFIVAVDIESRRDRGLPLIRIASPVQPEWLIDLFPDRIEERDGVEWNRAAGRVEQVSAMAYDGLVITATRSGAPDPEAAAALLAEKALEAGIGRFVPQSEIDALRARAQFAGIALDDEGFLRVLAEACTGRRSFAELEREDVLAPLRKKLERLTPSRLRLPGGRETQVHYAAGQPPWIASRLQDFFGMQETPRINGTPVVVHLLAPNQRPVQMTTDLAGFWERLYPQVRRELSRRYPRHKWPEKPV